MNRRSALGRRGEEAAVDVLKAAGLHILGRNVRLPGGEIDVIAKDGETVVFVEVKARTTATFGSALGAVDARKRRKLRALAGEWLQLFAPGAFARFDVIAADDGRLAHVKDAFR